MGSIAGPEHSRRLYYPVGLDFVLRELYDYAIFEYKIIILHNSGDLCMIWRDLQKDCVKAGMPLL